MSAFEILKVALLKIVGRISPSAAHHLKAFSRQPEETEALRHRVERLERELGDLRGLVETLNRDLDESRRLNLRAAEVMDVAFGQLTK
ncbi:hypothetical protein [Specibacter sp. RAF43]|uniref:hypothetical protein n=1 Tax=Specibacter sp. RAF43 TaxID=3233057 RepID=UPI003F982F09